jgi:hypothetical protein
MIAIQALKLIHLIITLFVVGAWLLPWERAWMVNLFFIPALIIHWKTNNNDCVLTNIEHGWLKKHRPDLLEADKAQGEFTRRLLRPFLGNRELTRAEMMKVIYGSMALSWIVCAMRLWGATGAGLSGN